MTTASMSNLPTIDPGGPIRTGADQTVKDANAVVSLAADIKVTWSGLTCVYRAPEQYLVYEAMDRPVTRAEATVTHVQAFANALHDYANRCDVLRTRRAGLVSDINTFNNADHGDMTDPADEKQYLHKRAGFDQRARDLASDLDEAQRTCRDAIQAIASPDASPSSCDVATTTYSGEIEGTYKSINLGLEGQISIREVRNSDGTTTWVVEVMKGGHLGGHFKWDGKGAGPDAGFKAGLTGSGKESYNFDNAGDAQTFMKAVAAKEAVTAVSPALKWVHFGVEHLLGGNSYRQPNEIYYDVGATGSADISGGGTWSWGAGIAGTALAGVSVARPDKGNDATYTYHMKGDASINGSFPLSPYYGGKVEYADGVAVSLTYDAKGPSVVTYERTGKVVDTGEAGVGPVSGSASISDEVKEKVEIKVDAAHPENRDALADALHYQGIPLMPNDGSSVTPTRAVDRLLDRATELGPEAGVSFTSDRFATKSAEAEVSEYVARGLTYGGSGKLGVDWTNATGSSTWDPVTRTWIPSEPCD